MTSAMLKWAETHPEALVALIKEVFETCPHCPAEEDKIEPCCKCDDIPQDDCCYCTQWEEETEKERLLNNVQE